MSNKAPGSVSVEIYDQTYHLRGVDPEHITALAQIVDGKMRAVSAHGATVDSLRVAECDHRCGHLPSCARGTTTCCARSTARKAPPAAAPHR